jgi:hypothetical protein
MTEKQRPPDVPTLALPIDRAAAAIGVSDEEG